MPPNAEIFFEHAGLGRPLAWSLALHAALTAVIFGAAILMPGHRGEGWGAGGGGDAIGATLGSTVPLPASPVQTQNVGANESKGGSQSLPPPEGKGREATPIPEKKSKKNPKPQPPAGKRKPEPVEPPPEESNV